jgi:EAL domain-containing protein (putative c-di-GMP-specific phosphodiesterase class I)
VLIALLLVLAWAAAYALGGASKVAPHWFYVPILLAASRYGSGGAAAAAVAAGLLAGPLVPAIVETGTPQAFADWGTRAGFFLAIGQAMAWVMNRRRMAAMALVESKRTISDLATRLEVRERETASRRQAAERIRGVLADESINIVFQPIANLRNGGVVGVEALARFAAEPKRSPDRWFAEAWEVGLGTQLELMALRRAVAWADRLPAELFVSVNVSPGTLTSPEFQDILHSVMPGRLVVEVTEHAAVEDYRALAEPLVNLRARGARLAVDDVGAGYASLRHILRLAPDVIKLDVDLTRGIDADRARHALAAGLIAFAAELGAAVVAEGIETGEELDTLRGLGASFGQGYYLARPAPLPALDLRRPTHPAGHAGRAAR